MLDQIQELTRRHRTEMISLINDQLSEAVPAMDALQTNNADVILREQQLAEELKRHGSEHSAESAELTVLMEHQNKLRKTLRESEIQFNAIKRDKAALLSDIDSKYRTLSVHTGSQTRRADELGELHAMYKELVEDIEDHKMNIRTLVDTLASLKSQSSAITKKMHSAVG